MPGHTRDLSPATYFERFIAALVRQSAEGELRVKGSDFDKLTNEATTLTFYWDGDSQEIVVRGAKSTELVIDVFRVTPENAAAPSRAAIPSRTVDPLDKTLFRRGAQDATTPFVATRSNANPMEDSTAAEIENDAVTRRAKELIRDELRRRRSNG